MTDPAPPRRKRHWGTWIVVAVAGLVGLKFGYDFGHQVSGRGLGVVTGLNGALFCSVIADAITTRWARWWDQRSSQQRSTR